MTKNTASGSFSSTGSAGAAVALDSCLLSLSLLGLIPLLRRGCGPPF